MGNRKCDIMLVADIYIFLYLTPLFSYSIQQLQDTNKCLVHKNFEFHRSYLPRLSAEDIRHRGYLPRISAEDIPTTLTNVPITKIQLKERNQSHIHLLLPRVKSCDLKWQTYRTYNVLNSAGN